MKKSKMIKSVGETLGEIQGERKIWVDTKFIEKWGRAIDWYFTAPVDRNGFIYFSGIGACDAIAENLATKFSGSSIPSCRLACCGCGSSLGCLRPDDMVILLSEDGMSPEPVFVARRLRAYGAVGVSITCSPNSPLAEACSIS